MYEAKWDIGDHYKAARMGQVHFLLAFPPSFYTTTPAGYKHLKTIFLELLRTPQPVDWPRLLNKKFWNNAWTHCLNSGSQEFHDIFLCQGHLANLHIVWPFLSDEFQTFLKARREDILHDALVHHNNIDLLDFVMETLQPETQITGFLTEDMLCVLPFQWTAREAAFTWAWNRGFLSLEGLDLVDIIACTPKNVTPEMRQWFIDHPFPNSDILIEEMMAWVVE